jgi:hypothetical protein
LNQTDIATATAWPKDTPVELQASVTKVYDLARAAPDSGKDWIRQDFVVQDSTGVITCKWFRPRAQIEKGQLVTVHGKMDDYGGRKNVNVSEVDFGAGGAAPMPSAPSPQAPPPMPPPQAPPPPSQPVGQMGVDECVKVLSWVQTEMTTLGFQDERAVQAFCATLLIGMHRGDISRNLPNPDDIPF